MAKSNKSQRPAKDVYLTPEGLKEAREELHYLQTEKRNQIAERIQKAREFGDIEENSEYDAALDEQVLVENRIAYLEEILKNPKLINEHSNSEFVVIGSTVAVEIDKAVDEFTIVGKMEADPAKKLISNESPLGIALLGAKIGEEVDVRAPIVSYKCKVLKIK